MSRYIEAPNFLPIPFGEESLFLAGGITDVEDWQKRAVDALRGLPDMNICNPRRKNWDMNSSSEVQIQWENMYLTSASQVLFWFSKETVQPIALYELGVRVTEHQWRKSQELFIGCHPEYPRKADLAVQLPLAGYDKPLVHDLDELLQKVIDWNAIVRAAR